VVVRFPWGSVFSLRCGSWAAPLDVASGGLFTFPAPSLPCSECLPFDPRRSRVQERGRSLELFAPNSFGHARTRRTARPTPFQRRGYELSSDVLHLRRAFTEPCRPLTFSSSPVGTSESVSEPPDPLACRPAPLRDGVDDAFDLRARGLGIALPVKA
jgi:hypothetical protein